MFLYMAIGFALWGAWTVGKAAYTAAVWERVEGIVVDFPRHVYRCGKGRSECYTVNVGYHVNGDYFTVDSDRIYSKPPKELQGDAVTVYFSASDPSNATLGGDYGPMDRGYVFLFAGGALYLLVMIFGREGNPP